MRYGGWAGLLVLMASLAQAQKPVVLYRCTDARGVVTLQNDVACPKGSAQEKRIMERATSAAPFPMPLPAPAAGKPAMPAMPATTVTAPAGTEGASPTAVLPLPAPTLSPAERLPPPPLYQCNTVENDSYLSDSTDPKPRCVRMSTMGIDGSQSMGAGEACSMVYDQCQRIADNAACPAWRKRVNEAQSAWTFARADSAAQLKAEYERIARVVAETSCNE